MTITKATAAELVRDFARVSDAALTQPVVVTKNGRPRHVLVSIEEYDRLKRRDQMAFRASETPERFLADIQALANSEDE